MTASPWRVVEAQHRTSTRKLTDSLNDQHLLEQVIDRHKPAAPPARRPLHYLLYTPFRYRPPLRHGSRFGNRHEPGIWYGAQRIATAFAERAFYDLQFVHDSDAALSFAVYHTAFRAALRAGRGIDLTAPPYDQHRDRLCSPTSYQHTRPLGSAMRQADAQMFRYPSAREPEHRPCYGVFSPDAFARIEPTDQQTWQGWITPTAATYRRTLALQPHDGLEFPISQFLFDGGLPIPPG